MLIILELAPNGYLRNKLKNHPDTSKDVLLKYTVEYSQVGQTQEHASQMAESGSNAKRRVTTKSDVSFLLLLIDLTALFRFGVFAWEIFSYCQSEKSKRS